MSMEGLVRSTKTYFLARVRTVSHGRGLPSSVSAYTMLRPHIINYARLCPCPGESRGEHRLPLKDHNDSFIEDNSYCISRFRNYFSFSCFVL